MLVTASDGVRRVGGTRGENHFEDLERSSAKSSAAGATRSRVSKTLCCPFVLPMLLKI